MAPTDVQGALAYRHAGAGEGVRQPLLRLRLQSLQRAPLGAPLGICGPSTRSRIGRLAVHLDAMPPGQPMQIACVHGVPPHAARRSTTSGKPSDGASVIARRIILIR